MAIDCLTLFSDAAIGEISTMFRNIMTILQRDNDEDMKPVYSYTKPTRGVQLILHVMLSMGRFATEIYLIMHNAIRDSLRYVKLISPSDNPQDLE